MTKGGFACWQQHTLRAMRSADGAAATANRMRAAWPLASAPGATEPHARPHPHVQRPRGASHAARRAARAHAGHAAPARALSRRTLRAARLAAAALSSARKRTVTTQVTSPRADAVSRHTRTPAASTRYCVAALPGMYMQSGKQSATWLIAPRGP
jgi:hypothetical protein